MKQPLRLTRRRLVGLFSALAGATLFASRSGSAGMAAGVTNADTDSGSPADWSELTEAQWQERLTAEEFRVLRDEGTERPFTSALNDEKRAGTYVCAGCALPLFDSEHKYDSGTGWPSFWRPLPDALDTKRDFKLILPRTEYHCRRCGGHQGHVFDDGPRPTGERWCNNGVALDFVPQDAA